MMNPLIIPDFCKGEYSDFMADISLWGEEDIRLFVDIPEVKNSTLEQCIDAINQQLSWLDENRNTVVKAILDSDVFSNIQEWTSETVTREKFAEGLSMSEIAISFKWNQTMIYIIDEYDYFSGHCICVYMNDKNEITGCVLEG